ncbi:transcription antitermination factor NusB [Thermodesulfobacteriota bacterium]
MPSRRKTREFVLQVLFAADCQNQDPLKALGLLGDNFVDDEEVIGTNRVMMDFAVELIGAISRERDAIDEMIARLSHNWKIHRMSMVDRNVLRMAVAEITSFPEIPALVTLNEAVDLGKKYGTDNSPAFINGILDRIHSFKNVDSGELTVRDLLVRLDESDTTG